jgi:hypothetical protein
MAFEIAMPQLSRIRMDALLYMWQRLEEALMQLLPFAGLASRL